jgi:hypothetical protein
MASHKGQEEAQTLEYRRTWIMPSLIQREFNELYTDSPACLGAGILLRRQLRIGVRLVVTRRVSEGEVRDRLAMFIDLGGIAVLISPSLTRRVSIVRNPKTKH